MGAENGSPEKISQAMKVKPFWNKGIANLTASTNGKNGSAKQSATVTGRRIAIIDGKRTWFYPNQSN